MKFPFYKQPDAMLCGPTCLRMIAKHYNRTISLEKLKRLSETTRSGSSLKNVADAAENIGFRSLGVKVSFEKLKEEAPLPCIVHWHQNHFVVVYAIENEKWTIGNLFRKSSANRQSSIKKSSIVKVADPAHGLLKFTAQEFIDQWIGKNANENEEDGIALLLEPTPRLHQTEEDDVEKKRGFRFLYQYLFRYKKFIVQLVLGLLVGSLLQLIFPFLTQSVVDVGIQNRDINFIYLILIAELFLFLGQTSVNIIRGWILLHLLIVHRQSINSNSFLTPLIPQPFILPFQQFNIFLHRIQHFFWNISILHTHAPNAMF